MLLFIEITTEQMWWLIYGLVGGVVLLGSMAAAWKSVRGEFLMPLKKMLEPIRLRRREVKALPPVVSAMKASLDRIEAELKTNGGHSLKDVVNRIAKTTDHIQARVRHQDETNDKPIFEMDARGHITFANCAFCDLVQADEADLLHRNWISRIRNDEQVRMLNELETAIENMFPLETTASFKLISGPIIGHGRTVEVRIRANPHVRPGGELLGFFGTVTPIK